MNPNICYKNEIKYRITPSGYYRECCTFQNCIRYARSGTKYCKRHAEDSTLKQEVSSDPTLVMSWDFELNVNLDPHNLTFGSHKEVWWKCLKNDNHPPYKASIYTRSKTQSGCPYCDGKKVCKDNCLETKFPELVLRWDQKLNDITPKDITPFSHKKVWWKCLENSNHPSYLTRVADFTHSNNHNNHNCPYCNGKKVCKDNCLAEKNPLLSSQWNYNMNEGLTPYDITEHSRKQVWWLCPVNSDHPSWLSTVDNRSRKRNPKGCPTCCESQGEKIIYNLIHNKVKVIRQFKFNCSKSLSYDFYIEIDDKKGLIEFDGKQHFEYVPHFFKTLKQFERRQELDAQKEELTVKYQIPLLRISFSEQDIEKCINTFIDKLKTDDNYFCLKIGKEY